jgi:hypothetical protein
LATYLAASFAPRIEQAASQIQDSRDLLVGLDMKISVRSRQIAQSKDQTISVDL